MKKDEKITGCESTNYTFDRKCEHMLPCGVCEKTGNICPVHGYPFPNPSGPYIY